jgi:hypothetical protein
LPIRIRARLQWLRKTSLSAQDLERSRLQAAT